MRVQRAILWTAAGSGLAAAAAGMAGMDWIAGRPAVVMLIAFLLAPWARQEQL